MRHKSRPMKFAVVLLAMAVFTQGCTLSGEYLFFANVILQHQLKNRQFLRVMEIFLPLHLAVLCSGITINGAVNPPGPSELTEEMRAKLPKKMTVRLQTFPAAGGGETYDYTMKVGKDGRFEGTFDSPNGTLFASDPKTRRIANECAETDLDDNTFVAVFLRAIGGSVDVGELIALGFVVRPIVELEECTPQIIPTSKTPNVARWIRRPGKSPLPKPIAFSGGQGIRVHCQQTADGEQGTIRVRFTDGTTEIIGVTCNDA